METIDAHCHLDQIDGPAGAVARAGAAGVRRILAVSEDSASMRVVLDLKRAHPASVLAGLGFHPARVAAASPEVIERELACLSDHIAEADALGEVGLDFKHADTPERQELQAAVLDRMLAMAAARGKPANLHSRRAQRQTMERAIRFKAETGLNAVMHWFTASKKLIKICASEGIFVSAGPSVLFDEHARETAVTIPIDLLLVETDSPVQYGDPAAAAEPAWARDVTKMLASAFTIDPAELGQVVSRNFARYLTTGG